MSQSATRHATLLGDLAWFSKSCKVILASKSPRRKEILEKIGLQLVRCLPSTFDEDLDKSKYPSTEAYCLDTATHKGNQVAELVWGAAAGQAIANGNGDAHLFDYRDADVIISSDTIIDLDGTVIEKPADHADAVRILSSFSGRSHKVHTAVVIHTRKSDNPIRPAAAFVDTAEVRFADLGRDDIEAYVATGEPFDKAGGYGIQGIGGQFVSGISGDYFSVMGLPMHALAKQLAELKHTGKL
eukprot:GDKI01025923.1.p1 GENE.GDKI01025923.1~~GDKI01025923.1.p1  ORF type:complete len:242 (-),score=73.06 GDKI01025923.1:60-785(-)